MHSSLLARSVVAVASFAIGSVTLAAAPASAATEAGTTRDEVLPLANTARATGNVLTPAASAVAREILRRECKSDEGWTINDTSVITVDTITPSTTVDGVFLRTDLNKNGEQSYPCAVAVVAPVASGTNLGGWADLSTTERGLPSMRMINRPIVGDVAANVFPPGQADVTTRYSYDASGHTFTDTTTTTITKITTPKSKAQKKYAKKKYDKRLKAAHTSYKKALVRAHGSRTKKAAAKTTYRAERVAARTKYKKAFAGFTLSTRTTTSTSLTPFRVFVSDGPPPS